MRHRRKMGSAMQSIAESRLFLAWLAKVRILILTVLLGIELAIAQFTPLAFPLRVFVVAILLACTISVFPLVLLQFGKEFRLHTVLHVATDLPLVSSLIYAPAGVDTSLNFLYPLVIIAA